MNIVDTLTISNYLPITDTFNLLLSTSEELTNFALSPTWERAYLHTRIDASIKSRIMGLLNFFLIPQSLTTKLSGKIIKSLSIASLNNWSIRSIGRTVASTIINIYAAVLKIAIVGITILLPEIGHKILGLKYQFLAVYFASKVLNLHDEELDRFTVVDLFQLIHNCIITTNEVNFVNVLESRVNDCLDLRIQAYSLNELFNISLDSYPRIPSAEELQLLIPTFNIVVIDGEVAVGGEIDTIPVLGQNSNFVESFQQRANRIISPRKDFHTLVTKTLTSLLDRINTTFINTYYSLEDIQYFGNGTQAFSALTKQATVTAIRDHFLEDGEWKTDDKSATITIPEPNSDELVENEYPNNYAFGSPRCLDSMRNIKRKLNHFLQFTELKTENNSRQIINSSKEELFGYLLLYIMHDEENELVHKKITTHPLHTALSQPLLNQEAYTALKELDTLIDGFATEYICKGLLNQGKDWEGRESEKIKLAFHLP